MNEQQENRRHKTIQSKGCFSMQVKHIKYVYCSHISICHKTSCRNRLRSSMTPCICQSRPAQKGAIVITQCSAKPAGQMANYAYLLCTSVFAVWRIIRASRSCRTAIATLFAIPRHERLIAFAPSSLHTMQSLASLYRRAYDSAKHVQRKLHLPAEYKCTDCWGEYLCRKQRAQQCCSDHRSSCRILHSA